MEHPGDSASSSYTDEIRGVSFELAGNGNITTPVSTTTEATAVLSTVTTSTHSASTLLQASTLITPNPNLTPPTPPTNFTNLLPSAWVNSLRRVSYETCHFIFHYNFGIF